MSEFWAIFLIIVVGLACFIFVWFLEKVRKETAINNFHLNRHEILTTWEYAPAEWRYAAQENFNLRPKEGETGSVSFTPQYIYISNGKKEILWEIVGDDKYVKHLTNINLLKISPLHTIKFEVNKKVVKTNKRENEEEEKCTSEEFYVSVPLKFQNEAEKVLRFYENIIDNNADAVAAVMPYGLGMFGR